VASKATGEHEERTRVICHLPLNSAAEEKAFKEVISYVETQREKKIGLEGHTYSDPKAFCGRWWGVGANWISDKIVLLIIDYRIALTDHHNSLSDKIRELKNKVHQSYAHYGRPQEEVWVVAFSVTRHL
jgi:hypothetical protein